MTFLLALLSRLQSLPAPDITEVSEIIADEEKCTCAKGKVITGMKPLQI